MSRKKKAAPKKQIEKRNFQVLFVRPAVLCVDVDMAFIAEHRPRFTLKDLVVFAMAIGGKVRQPRDAKSLLTARIEFEIPVEETR